MGYLFHLFWFSKPNCVSVWAYQVGLLTPVQTPYGDQPQFRPGSLKRSEIFISIVWRAALLNAFPLNLMKSLTFPKFSLQSNFPDFFPICIQFSRLFYFKGARPKIVFLSLNCSSKHCFHV
jgi:hypothetical protein